jgi:hypothetical protein
MLRKGHIDIVRVYDDVIFRGAATNFGEFCILMLAGCL